MSGFLAQVQQQTLTILPSRVRFLLLKHLPPSHAGRLIEFHSGMLHPTLVAAVKACVFFENLHVIWGEPGISSHAQHIVRPVLVKARTILLFSVNCCSSLQKPTNGTHK